MEPNIVFSHVTKTYKGGVTALEDVSFSVGSGVFGLLGHNGAGKSTLMRALVTVEPPNSGAIQVCGFDTVRQGRAVRQRLGYLPQELPMYPSLSVRDFLGYMGELKGLRDKSQVENVLAQVEMQDFARRKIGQLSGGMRRRVGIAQALLGNPPVLILDEPTVGLDPKQIIEIRNLIKSLGRKHTVILSSHILSEVQAVCERILVINNGRIVADGATDTLAHDLSPDHRLILRAEGPEKEMVHALQNVPGVVDAYSLGEKEKGVFEVSVESTPDNDIRRDVFALMARKGWPMLALKNTDLTLEDLFLQLTSTDAALLPSQEDEDGGAPQLDPDQDLDLDAGEDGAPETDEDSEKGGEA